MAKGAYLGIDGTARKVAGGYIGVDGVARKIKKAYVGVDGVAQLWWVLDEGGGPIVLEVEKVTADTYAGGTTYTGEQFILLNICPKTNGTVSVTYGGLTKTVTDTSGAESPNYQQVFFGTFNGVSDSVTTPASGTLTIEGECAAFGVGNYVKDSKSTFGYCSCIIGIVEWGNVIELPVWAFHECSELVVQELPEGLESIGEGAFSMKATSSQITGSSEYEIKWETAMEGGTIVLPSTVKSIGGYAFSSTSTVSEGSSSSRHCYLGKIKLLAEEPPVLGAEPFGGFIVSSVSVWAGVLEVPKGCGEAYKTAEGWTGYTRNIVEVS